MIDVGERFRELRTNSGKRGGGGRGGVQPFEDVCTVFFVVVIVVVF